MLRQNIIQLAYADDDESDDDESDDDERDDDVPTDLSTLTNEKLVKLFQGTATSLEQLADVLDEAAVVDVAKQKITNLQNKVKQLTIDKDLKKDLLKILDEALKKLNKIDKPILSGKEDKANKKIKDVQKILSDFVSKVKDKKGKKIFNTLTDVLINDATIISSDLGKRGRDIIPVIQSFSLPLVRSLIDISKVEIQTGKDIVAELQSRGVEIQVDAEINSPIAPVVIILGIKIGIAAWNAFQLTSAVSDELVKAGEPPLNDHEYAGLFLINAAGFFALDKFVTVPIAKQITKELALTAIGLSPAAEFVLGRYVNQILKEFLVAGPLQLSQRERDLIIFLRDKFQPPLSLDGIWQYREQDRISQFPPDFTFTKESTGDKLLLVTGTVEGATDAYIFKSFKKSDIENHDIKITWSGTSPVVSGVNEWEFTVTDGAYDRTSFTDFPINVFRTFKGAGILDTVDIQVVSFGEQTDTLHPNWAASQLDEVTILVRIADSGIQRSITGTVRSIEIVGVATWTFTDPIITPEQSGTTNDFGTYTATLTQ